MARGDDAFPAPADEDGANVASVGGGGAFRRAWVKVGASFNACAFGDSASVGGGGALRRG